MYVLWSSQDVRLWRSLTFNGFVQDMVKVRKEQFHSIAFCSGMYMSRAEHFDSRSRSTGQFLDNTQPIFRRSHFVHKQSFRRNATGHPKLSIGVFLKVLL